MTKPLVLKPVRKDVATAVCQNRRECVLAHAVDRQLGLKGRGYVRVDANRMAMLRPPHASHIKPGQGDRSGQTEIDGGVVGAGQPIDRAHRFALQPLARAGREEPLLI